jgi:phosphoglycolate phosphatase-like HAD superfamily hydrolase
MRPSADEQRPSCVVIDIDGVLADVRHRLHHVAGRPKDWDAFFAAASADPLLEPGARLARDVASSHTVVYLTGRPERLRSDTEAWLRRHELPPGTVVMRPEGDRRPATLVKLAALRKLRRRSTVALVVDDDAGVLDAARAAGFPVRLADWMPGETGTLHRAQQPGAQQP